MFDRARVIHLTASQSDHSPILLCQNLDIAKMPRPFRFIEAWTHDSTCEIVINEAWQEATR